MKILHSVCTNMVFPESRKKISAFQEMASFLAERGIEGIEFYHDGDGKDRIGNILSDTGLNGVYIAVIPSKEQKLHLCDIDETGRRKALQLYRDCIDTAQGNGIGTVMMNSGHIQRELRPAMEALYHSVEDIYDYAEKKNYSDFKLTIEPCDTHMDACQLIGPVSWTKEFLKKCNDNGLPLALTLDSAHTSEEGDDFADAVFRLKQYCRHIHFANCDIVNPDSELFGDKHLGFEYPDTVWGYDKLKNLTGKLSDLYEEDEVLRIGIEVLCREENPYVYFDEMWQKLSFIHE